jgi:hypothetical protein
MFLRSFTNSDFALACNKQKQEFLPFATHSVPAQISNRTEQQKPLPNSYLYNTPTAATPPSVALGVPRGNAWVPFFRHFLGRTKKWHKMQTASACEAQCERP